jgi:hypothetical protein
VDVIDVLSTSHTRREYDRIPGDKATKATPKANALQPLYHPLRTTCVPPPEIFSDLSKQKKTLAHYNEY